jgi:hypothetical protein
MPGQQVFVVGAGREHVSRAEPDAGRRHHLVQVEVQGRVRAMQSSIQPSTPSW